MILLSESYDEMNEVLAFELIESLDKDGDNRISYDEYIGYIPDVDIPVGRFFVASFLISRFQNTICTTLHKVCK